MDHDFQDVKYDPNKIYHPKPNPSEDPSDDIAKLPEPKANEANTRR
jgi:hypothetical protein